jgi:predicted TIM-barrel fold metal-dependent hydrolase
LSDRIEVVDAQLHLNLLGVEAALVAMDAVGVDAVLVDEFWGYDDDGNQIPGRPLPGGSFRTATPVSELAVALHPHRFAQVVRYRPDDPDLPRLVEELRSHPNRLALRITPFQLRPDAASFEANAAIAQRDFDAIASGACDGYFAHAQRHEVPIFLQIAGVEVPPQLAMVEHVLRAFPELQVIIDHCGVTLPADAVASRARTRAQVAELTRLAAYANAALKWGHAPELSSAPYPHPDLIELLHMLLDAFGADRIMWASDWMPGVTPHSWGEALYYLLDAEKLSHAEKTAILGGTVRRLLRWPRPAATQPVKARRR